MKPFDRNPLNASIRPAPPDPRPTPLPSRHPLEGLGPIAIAGETELRNRMFVLTRPQRAAMIAALIVPPLVAIAILLVILADVETVSDSGTTGGLFDAFRAELWKNFTENIVHAVLFAVTTLIGMAGVVRGFRERVFVGPGGIRYFSGRPSWLGPLQGNWSVPADQIRGIEVAHSRLAKTPSMLQLVIETAGKTRRLFIFTFVDPADHQSKAFRVLARIRPDPEKLAALFDSMPLVRHAREAGYETALPEVPAPSLDLDLDFSLQDSPRVSVALILVFAVFAYAVVDMGLISETYATGVPFVWIGLGALAAGGLTWLLLGSREPTRLVRGSVAGFACLAMMLALHPGLIRINRIGAPDPEPHAYRHVAPGRLEPVAPTSPELDLPDIVELLPGSQEGDIHELWLRAGRLGFHQVDIDAFDRWVESLERDPSTDSENG